jgi:hypothetical protein
MVIHSDDATESSIVQKLVGIYTSRRISYQKEKQEKNSDMV